MLLLILLILISGSTEILGLVDNQVEYVPGMIRKITCDYIPLLAFKKMRSHLECSMWCSLWDDCRRYMFCRYADGIKGGCVLFKSYQECLNIKDDHPCICRVKKSLRRSDGTHQCFAGYYGSYCENIIQDCKHGSTIPALKNEGSVQQLFIQPYPTVTPFQVFCSFNPTSSDIFISSRNYDPTKCNTPFNQTMEVYERGFGRFPKGYWLGLAHLNILTSIAGRNPILRIVVQSDTMVCEELYEGFSVSDVNMGYQLNIGNRLVSGNIHSFCSGAIGSGPLASTGHQFTTYDTYTGSFDCPRRMQSGWWFANDVGCTSTNLNGPITPNASPRITYDPDFSGDNIKKVEMYIVCN